MKQRIGLSLLAACVVIGVSFLIGCSGENGGSGSLTGSVLGIQTAEGLRFAAERDEVVIDLTDPATPTDPDNDDKHYGETGLVAQARDPETNEPMPGAEIRFRTAAGKLASGGAPVTANRDGIAKDTLRLYEDDPEQVECGAMEADRVSTDVVTVTVIMPNSPPVADAGDDFRVECTSPDGAVVILDGSNSSDPDSTPGTNDDIVLFEWWLQFDTADQVSLGQGETIRAQLPVGVHDITLVVTDSQRETDSDGLRVGVMDTQPPRVDLRMSPSELWPPNHKMRDVHADLRVADCSPVEIVLVDVYSNEPDNGSGDGNHEPDIMGVEAGTEDYDFQLRAERSGNGSGRVYTVIYMVTDEDGLETRVRSAVTVPHNQ